jgi:hypothetical protein
MGKFLNKNIKIEHLKKQIFDKTSIHPGLFILTYNDKKLSNNKLLSNIDKNIKSLDLKIVLKQKLSTAQIVEMCDKLPDNERRRHFIDTLYYAEGEDKLITTDQKILLNAKYQNNFSGKKFSNNVAVIFIKAYKPYESNQSYGISELINAGLINKGQEDEIKRKLRLSSNSSSSSRLNNIALKKKLSINEAVDKIKNSKVPLTKIQNLIKNGTINEKNYPNIINKIYELHKNNLKK